jgi:dihydrofolate reductase
MERPLSLIVAASDNDVIGRDGQLPWRLSADLRRFKQLTMGHHLVMGRKTFESIGRPLPGRTTIVLTRQPDYTAEGAVVAHSPAEVLSLTAADSEPFVVGGAEIYRLLLPWVGKIYLTRVHCFIDGDTLFNFVRWDDWDIQVHEAFFRNEQNEYDYSFFNYGPKEADLPPLPLD